MTRKGFIGGLLASAGATGCRSTGWFGAKPNLSLGVISDIHITTPASTEMFRRALRYFRSRGADAVMVAGDLADWGLQSCLTCVKRAWDDEMAGSGIVPLFITGNHDYEGWWYGDMTLDMHLQGYSEDEALSRLGMKACWEKTMGEPFDEIRVRTVNGYAFVSAEWRGTEEGDNSERTAKWLAAHRAELAGEKPFFFFRHVPISGTVSSSPAKANPLFDVLSTFPNCIAFNGHTHWTHNDERSIWQGGFTAVSIPSISYTSIPKGYDNGSDRRRNTTTCGMERVVSREELKEAQGYFVNVRADEIEIARYDFEVEREISAPWIVPLPTSRAKPYAFAAHAQATPVPQFDADAVVKTDIVNADLRNGMWGIFVSLDFPSASAEDGRVYDYEVRAVSDEGKVVAMKRFLSPAFYKPRPEEPPAQHFLFNGLDLPETGRFRFAVVARNCFGAESAPIYSRAFAPKPGKDRTKYRSWDD